MIPDLILPHLMSVPLLYVFISPYMSVITVYFEFGFGNSTTVLNIQSRGSNIEIEIRKQHWNFSKSKTVFKQPNSKMLSPNQNFINQFWKTKVLKLFSQLPPFFNPKSDFDKQFPNMKNENEIEQSQVGDSISDLEFRKTGIENLNSTMAFNNFKSETTKHESSHRRTNIGNLVPKMSVHRHRRPSAYCSSFGSTPTVDSLW